MPRLVLFSAANLTFQNRYGPGSQAVAPLASGQRQQFLNCRFVGDQDTLYVKNGTQYFRNCHVQGSTDYLFGGATAVMDDCEARKVAGGSAVTAPNTDLGVTYGIVFLGGKLTAISGVTAGSVGLGRPWGADRSTAYLHTDVGAHIAAAGFVPMSPDVRPGDEARLRAEGDEARTVIAGYPWFGDWGRDTMISLEGLTLLTGRHREARDILQTFAHHVRDGLIPNFFPEGKTEGLYHTADATLWFFHALARYERFSGERETRRFLLPKLVEIASRHVEGTRFGIVVDEDGLLRQGADGLAPFFEGLGPALAEGCVGNVSEIFDAEPPFTARGCFAQAWSVAETLRTLATLAEVPGEARGSDGSGPGGEASAGGRRRGPRRSSPVA